MNMICRCGGYFEALGVTLREPEDWSCCGSTPAHTVDHVFAAALAARNLSIIEKMGTDTVTVPCPSCLSAFKKAHLGMTGDEAFKNKVNELLDEPYNGGVSPKSTLQIMVEDIGLEAIAGKVTHVLPDIVVAPYYGCILNRPPAVAQFDDPENPVSMDKILEAVGVKVSDFAFKLECCGGRLRRTQTGYGQPAHLQGAQYGPRFGRELHRRCLSALPAEP